MTTRRLYQLVLALGLATITAASTGAVALQDLSDMRPATAAEEEFIRDVLTDRFLAKASPFDRDVEGFYWVHAEVRGSKVKLSPAALPNVAGVNFSLITAEEATTRAIDTNATVRFI